MKHLLARGWSPAESVKELGSGREGLISKLLLGLSPRDYLAQAVRNPFNWILGLIFVVGLPLIAGRFFFGLGWVTHSSNDYPWGLFLGFGLLTHGAPLGLRLHARHHGGGFRPARFRADRAAGPAQRPARLSLCRRLPAGRPRPALAPAVPDDGRLRTSGRPVPGRLACGNLSVGSGRGGFLLLFRVDGVAVGQALHPAHHSWPDGVRPSSFPLFTREPWGRSSPMHRARSIPCGTRRPSSGSSFSARRFPAACAW